MADLFAQTSDPSPDIDSEQERRALVALSLVPGIGPGRVRSLLAAFGSATEVMRAPVSRLVRAEGIGRSTAASVCSWDDPSAVEQQFARAQSIGAHLLAHSDPGYPQALREIYDPPPFLWVRGRLDPADDPAVAIVGTRRASEVGLRAADHLAGDLARAGLTVISGLAYGIDIAAHRAALAAGGRTIAVLGSGVDHVYPSRHAPVVREILERDLGAIVSEFPLGTPPDATNFPRRNRIVSGLCVATVVAEAHVKGGAMLTAAMALEQNREVFAVPASVFASAQGTNRLIQQGLAALTISAADVLAVVAPQLGAGPPTEPQPTPTDLNKVERRLLDALESTPLPLDSVCATAEVDAPTALVYLLQLEFRGLVRQLAGKQFFRT